MATKAVLFLSFILSILWEAKGFKLTSRTKRIEGFLAGNRCVWRKALNSMLMSDNDNEALQNLDQISAKYRVTSFGQQQSVNNNGIECVDPKFYSNIVEIKGVSRIGGLGFDLIETQVGKGNAGLVLIGSIKPNSNAAKSGLFKPGDAILEIADSANLADKRNMRGLNFDSTVDNISSFQESVERFDIVVSRLVKREIIELEVYGNKGEFVESFSVPAGFGLNLRRELNNRGFKLYDENTYRFDSPYQTGDCGGDGTCGTCIVSIPVGGEVLSERGKVEDRALRAKGSPPSWRWACRTIVGAKGRNIGGKVKIVLRPQTAL